MKKLISLNKTLPTYKSALLQVVAFRNVRAVVDSALAKANINTTQWIILGLINDQPGELRITDVAKIIQVEGTLITNLVQSLIALGYILTATHARDGRARLLALTPSGKSLVRKVERQLAVELRPLEKGLSHQELARYFETLRVFINNTTPIEDGII